MAVWIPNSPLIFRVFLQLDAITAFSKLCHKGRAPENFFSRQWNFGPVDPATIKQAVFSHFESEQTASVPVIHHVFRPYQTGSDPLQRISQSINVQSTLLHSASHWDHRLTHSRRSRWWSAVVKPPLRKNDFSSDKSPKNSLFQSRTLENKSGDWAGDWDRINRTNTSHIEPVQQHSTRDTLNARAEDSALLLRQQSLMSNKHGKSFYENYFEKKTALFALNWIAALPSPAHLIRPELHSSRPLITRTQNASRLNSMDFTERCGMAWNHNRVLSIERSHIGNSHSDTWVTLL